MTRGSAEEQQAAGRAWRLLFDFFISTRPHRDRVLEQLALTPNDAKALNTMTREPGQAMSALARAWGTDASNATWVVDRLEKRGLAERRPDPRDRRVKLVGLTEKGEQAKRTILEAFYQPPPEFLTLEPAELQALDAIFEKLTRGPAAPET